VARRRQGCRIAGIGLFPLNSAVPFFGAFHFLKKQGPLLLAELSIAPQKVELVHIVLNIAPMDAGRDLDIQHQVFDPLHNFRKVERQDLSMDKTEPANKIVCLVAHRFGFQ